MATDYSALGPDGMPIGGPVPPDANLNASTNLLAGIGNTSGYNFSASGMMGTAQQAISSVANAVTGNSSTSSAGTSSTSSTGVTSFLGNFFDLSPTSVIARILFVLLGIVLLGGAIYVYKK